MVVNIRLAGIGLKIHVHATQHCRNSMPATTSRREVGENSSDHFTGPFLSDVLRLMPVARVNGVQLSYETHGAGRPILLVPPAGTSSAIWLMHQVPALLEAGYKAVTFDSRGMAPSQVPPGPYLLADLVADAAGLITELGIGPCTVIGASLGAMVAQELTLANPGLVIAAVMLATRSRTDFFRTTMARATAARMRDETPASRYETVAHMAQMLGAATLANDQAAADWFTLLRRFPVRGPGPAAQYEATVTADRTSALAGICRPCLVIAFGEDSVTPPAFCLEVANAIPSCSYLEIPAVGHFGFLEAPAAVNGSLLRFLSLVYGHDK
jgi:pimeloyl-ACP methyl ester carboxylesterase